MNPRHFYLNIDLCGNEDSSLCVRQLLQQAVSGVFGESGAALGVDVLRAEAGRALLRVPASGLRRFRAALALYERPIRVLGESPSLQALI